MLCIKQLIWRTQKLLAAFLVNYSPAFVSFYLLSFFMIILNDKQGRKNTRLQKTSLFK